MDFNTLTVDQFDTLDADGFDLLVAEDIDSNSSSSPSSFSSNSSSSSSTPSSASNSSSSSHDHSESSSSSSTHSSGSSSSSSSAPLTFPHTLDGHRYLTIAQAYADAFEGQAALVTHFEDAVQALKCLEDVEVATSLLGVFWDAFLLAETRYASTTPFHASVAALQQHIEARSGLTVEDWIEVAVPGALIPYTWAMLSKKVGYDIDSVIDWTTAPSSSTS